MNKTGKFLPVSLATMFIFGAISLAASASDSTATTENDVPRPAAEMRVGQRADVQAAIEASDYDAWVKAISINGQIPEFLKVITKDTFPKFAEAHNYQKQAMELMKKSETLMEEIGFKHGPGFKKGEGPRGGKGMFR